MFSAHTGAIKCLATNDRYLVSGGSDEVIKYHPLRSSLTIESTISKNAKTWVHWYNIMGQSQPYNSTLEHIFSAPRRTGRYVFGGPVTGNVWQRCRDIRDE